MAKPAKSAREAAVSALIEFRMRGAWPDKLLRSSLGGMSSEDIGLATAIAYGVLQNRELLDFYISAFSSMKLNRVMPQVLDAMRVGAYQLLFMDKVPAYAAINESVRLARAYGGTRAAGFSNAVLRALDRGRSALPEPDRTDVERYFSIKYSHPLALVCKLVTIFGAAECEKLLAANNAPAAHAARVNTLKTDTHTLLSMLDEGAAREHSYLPDALIFDSLRGLADSEALAKGLYHLMDTASQLCVLALAPKPGGVLIDMCAAPGGKTLMAAQLMRGQGSIIARDVHDNKVKRLSAAIETCGLATIVKAKTADASIFDKALEGIADFIICDVPCSGFGIIRKKPDIRYKSLESAAALPDLQLKILQNAARYLRPGGVLVYSTCTIFPEENEGVVSRFLAGGLGCALEGFELPGIGNADGGMTTLLPHVHGTDGFFIAKIRKAK